MPKRLSKAGSKLALKKARADRLKSALLRADERYGNVFRRLAK